MAGPETNRRSSWHPWVGRALTLIGFPVAILAVGFGAKVVLGDGAILAGYFAGAALFGALANRWWAVGMPLLWIGGYIGVKRLIDLSTGDCSVCGSDDDWNNWPLIQLFFGGIPMTLAVLAGTGSRKIAERLVEK